MRTSFRAWRNRRTHCAQNAAGASPMGVRIPPRGPVLRRSPVGLRFGSSCRCWNGHTGGVESAVRKRPGSNPGRHTKICASGETGSHSGPKHRRLWAWEFESPLAHRVVEMCAESASQRLAKTVRGNTGAELALSEANGFESLPSPPNCAEGWTSWQSHQS